MNEYYINGHVFKETYKKKKKILHPIAETYNQNKVIVNKNRKHSFTQFVLPYCVLKNPITKNMLIQFYRLLDVLLFNS